MLIIKGRPSYGESCVRALTLFNDRRCSMNNTLFNQISIVKLFGAAPEKAGVSVDMEYAWGDGHGSAELKCKRMHNWIAQICV
jgi:hypothetical protein